ncbi:unnamed protein product [Vitrella brassicaformis CCMP3155]|uniref:Major facilitator superfamily (MFS) profile domain-containing protein n=2 Tax=Vitrella brassicaformis TaxID=1169539 RepID=A0A0G4GRV8_VITBC|nr:unnamed protein product [Vitrella brassicaformis CCMP3155]|eukprot:CEM33333.1 unnamed protein product [Vitrella brassicaformis CCMP3155]
MNEGRDGAFEDGELMHELSKDTHGGCEGPPAADQDERQRLIHQRVRWRGLHVGLLAVAWLTIFVETILYTVVIPIAPFALQTKPFIQGIVFAAHPLVAFFVTPVAGHFVDTYGWQAIMWVPYPLLILGCAVFLMPPSVPVYLLGRVILGVSSSFLWPAIMTAVSASHDDGCRSTATGIAYSADIGSVLGPSVGGVLFQLGGDYVTFATILALSVAVTCLALSLRNRLPSTLADNAQMEQEFISGESESTQERTPPSAARLRREKSRFVSFWEWHFCCSFMSLLYAWGCLLSLQALLPLYWRDRFGTSAGVVGSILFPCMLTKVVCAALMPLLADRYQLLPQVFVLLGVFLCCVAVSLVMAAAVLGVTAQAAIVAVAGGGVGMTDSCVVAFVGLYVKDRGFCDRGKGFAVLSEAVNLGIMVSPLLSSGLTQMVSYNAGFGLLGFCGLAVLVPQAYATWKYREAAARWVRKAAAHSSWERGDMEDVAYCPPPPDTRHVLECPDDWPPAKDVAAFQTNRDG